jgi:predicted nuclease with TOPRIM domain
MKKVIIIVCLIVISILGYLLIQNKKKLSKISSKNLSKKNNLEKINEDIEMKNKKILKLSELTKELKSKISEKDIDNNQNQEKVLSLNDSIKNMKGEKEDLENNLQLLKNEYAEEEENLKNKYDSLKDEYDGLKSKNVKEKDNTTTLNSKYQLMEDEMEIVVEERKTLQGKYSLLTKNHDNLENEMKQIKGNYTTLNDKYQLLEEQHDDFKSDNTKVQGDYTTLNNKYQSLEEEHNDLKSDNTKVQGDYTTLNNKYQSLEEEHNDLKSDNTKVQGDYTTLNDKYQLLEEEHKSLQKSRDKNIKKERTNCQQKLKKQFNKTEEEKKGRLNCQQKLEKECKDEDECCRNKDCLGKKHKKVKAWKCKDKKCVSDMKKIGEKCKSGKHCYSNHCCNEKCVNNRDVLWSGSSNFWNKNFNKSEVKFKDFKGIPFCPGELNRPKKEGETCKSDKECWHFFKGGGCKNGLCVKEKKNDIGGRCITHSNCKSGSCQFLHGPGKCVKAGTLRWSDTPKHWNKDWKPGSTIPENERKGVPIFSTKRNSWVPEGGTCRRHSECYHNRTKRKGLCCNNKCVKKDKLLWEGTDKFWTKDFDPSKAKPDENDFKGISWCPDEKSRFLKKEGETCHHHNFCYWSRFGGICKKTKFSDKTGKCVKPECIKHEDCPSGSCAGNPPLGILNKCVPAGQIRWTGTPKHWDKDWKPGSTIPKNERKGKAIWTKFKDFNCKSSNNYRKCEQEKKKVLIPEGHKCKNHLECWHNLEGRGGQCCGDGDRLKPGRCVKKNKLLWSGKEKFWTKDFDLSKAKLNRYDFKGIGWCPNDRYRPKKEGEKCNPLIPIECYHYSKRLGGKCKKGICEKKKR